MYLQTAQHVFITLVLYVELHSRFGGTLLIIYQVSRTHLLVILGLHAFVAVNLALAQQPTGNKADSRFCLTHQ